MHKICFYIYLHFTHLIEDLRKFKFNLKLLYKTVIIFFIPYLDKCVKSMFI